MVYEIKLIENSEVPLDVELLHENPQYALQVCRTIQCEFGEPFRIFRDSLEITLDRLASEAEAFAIQAVIQEENSLPSNFKHGRGGDSDLTLGANGYQHACGDILQDAIE